MTIEARPVRRFVSDYGTELAELVGVYFPKARTVLNDGPYGTWINIYPMESDGPWLTVSLTFLGDDESRPRFYWSFWYACNEPLEEGSKRYKTPRGALKGAAGGAKEWATRVAAAYGAS